MSKTTSTTTTAVSPADLRRFAADPMAFFESVSLIPDGPPFSTIMAPFQREFLLAVSPCLLAVARREMPPHRGAWAEMVKGAGKDSLCALCLLWLLAFSPRPVHAQIGADDLAQANEVKRSAQEWLQANPWLAARIEIFDRKIVNATTESTADVLTASRSSDAGGSHGSRPDFLILNEVSHISSEEYASTLLDNFAKMPGAFAILATNAGELGTWQHRWREMYRQDPRWLFTKVTDTPPWQSPADIQEAEKRNPPSRFQRLYRGIWSAPGGDALPEEHIRRAIVHDSPVYSRHTPAVYPCCGIGCDLAAGGRHHASVVVVLGDRYGRLRVARVVDFPPPVSISVVKQRIEFLGDTYRTRALFSDSWGAGLLAEQLVSAGWDVECTPATGNAARAAQAAALTQCFQDEVIELYSGDDGAELLLRDLQGCRLAEKSNGVCIELPETDDGHGDRLSALLQVLPPMLRAVGSMPISPGTGRGDEEREQEPKRDDPRDWRTKVLRPIGGWHAPVDWQG